MKLDNRAALVTGGTQGIGAAIAYRLAQAGCDLILVGLRDDSMAHATVQQCRELGRRVHLLIADLSQPSSEVIPGLCEQAFSLEPQLSILINNAGTFCDRPFLEMDWATYERTMRLNVESGYFLTQAFARRWVAAGIPGRVLFTGSINGELAEPDHTAYDTSKGAVRMMVRTLCVSLAPYGIRVNAMAPGLVVTPLTASALTPAATDWMKLHTPNGKVPGPEVCAGAALFLVSDEADHVHGQTLLVDGGMSVWQQPNPDGQ
ncbi:MAG: SDR family oxidoreductase [Planctomycetaceae bacterium]|nr:SDR family oxidoreductase [Planctomycetaceae bacterium]